jgi:peptide deformylase
MKIKRAKCVAVKAMDDTGKPVIIEAEDLLACVFQHEIDHLNGKLIIEYASWLDKIKIKNKLPVIAKAAKNERLRKQNTEPETM